MSPSEQPLPHVDEHSAEIAAGPEAVWEALLRVVEGSFGSAFPGFHVETAKRPHELALAGSHRFSDYALIFRLEELDNQRTRVRAETRALFPGFKGAVYQTLVIRTRGHVLVTHRLLSAAKRRAEQPRR